MGIFPTGAWYFETDLSDPLAWVPGLRGLPTSSGLVRCITGVLQLSAMMSALSLPAMPSDDEYEDEEDELEEEEPPAVIKVERTSGSKKGAVSAGSQFVDNDPPVRDA